MLYYRNLSQIIVRQRAMSANWNKKQKSNTLKKGFCSTIVYISRADPERFDADPDPDPNLFSYGVKDKV